MANKLIEGFICVIFTGYKNIIKADIQVDTYVKFKNDIPTKLLFTAYHNKKLKDELKEYGIIRVNNWQGIFNLL